MFKHAISKCLNLKTNDPHGKPNSKENGGKFTMATDSIKELIGVSFYPVHSQVI